jgi:hypothetical protein
MRGKNVGKDHKPRLTKDKKIILCSLNDRCSTCDHIPYFFSRVLDGSFNNKSIWSKFALTYAIKHRQELSINGFYDELQNLLKRLPESDILELRKHKIFLYLTFQSMGLHSEDSCIIVHFFLSGEIRHPFYVRLKTHIKKLNTNFKALQRLEEWNQDDIRVLEKNRESNICRNIDNLRLMNLSEQTTLSIYALTNYYFPRLYIKLNGDLSFKQNGRHLSTFIQPFAFRKKEMEKEMTINELGDKLKAMYDKAPEGDSVAMIHLFGIKYAAEILKNNYSRKDIIKKSGIPTSYATELSKGINLSKYVDLKK